MYGMCVYVYVCVCVRIYQDQSRNYDEYFTVTTIEGISQDLNTHRSTAAKQDNYSNHVVDNESADHKLLTTPNLQASEAEIAQAQSFLEVMYRECDLRATMQTNYRTNYPEKDGKESSKVMVFDGDFFRRIFTLLLRENSAGETHRDDIKAYFQYQIIKGASSYCMFALSLCLSVSLSLCLSVSLYVCTCLCISNVLIFGTPFFLLIF